MSNHAQSSPYVDDQEAILLHERALIDAKLATLQQSRMQSTPTATAHHGRPHLAQQDHVSRSRGQTSPSMSRTVSGRGPHEAPPLSSSRSQRSATNMTRAWSKGSSSSNTSMPWTNTGRVPPPLQIDAYAVCPEEPMSNYTLSQHQRPMARSLSQRQPELLERVQEIDSGVLPDAFFALNAMPALSVNPSPIDIPAGGEWRNPHQHRESFSSRRRPSFGIQTPTTPSTTTLTVATTYVSDMSRTNSIGNDVLGSFEMMHMNSNNSFYSDLNATDDLSYAAALSASYPKMSSSEDQRLLVAGAGASHQDLHPLLERSQSSESHVSNSSSKSRGATALHHQNQRAARPLAPKAGAEAVSMSREPSHTMMSIKSTDGSEDRMVAQIPKAVYQRPKHERVFCKLCSEYADGFRGLHELNRHIDRQHGHYVKKWVCIEPEDGIINSQFKPLNSLLRCKSCQMVKKYGAYYNAAAHLRRAHFKPKTRARSKCAKIDDKSEKRAGNGGGDWPPMSEMKRWMKEVLEETSENLPQEADEEEADDDDSGSNECIDDHAEPQGINDTSADFFNLDSTAMFDDAITTDADLTVHNSQGMQNMPYDSFASQHSIEVPAMHLDSSQSYVDSQLTSMNDPMAFIDTFPLTQEFDGLPLSQDFFNSIQYQM